MIVPWNRIPPEIISEIFSHCFSDYHMDIPPKSDNLPWKLGHICSLWRQVATNDIRLWSRISISNNCKTFLPMVETALRRAGPQVRFELCDHLCDPPIIETYITPYAGRFYNLTLTLNKDTWSDFLRLPHGLFVILEEIHFDIWDEDDFELPEEGLAVLEGASNLHTVRFTDQIKEMTGFLQNIGLPWGQLTHLIIDDSWILPSHAVRVLSLCPQLVICGL